MGNQDHIDGEETLDSLFDRISKSSSNEVNEIELEVTEGDDTEHAITLEIARIGDWLLLKGVKLNFKGLLVISILSSTLIYLIYGLPQLL